MAQDWWPWGLRPPGRPSSRARTGDWWEDVARWSEPWAWSPRRVMLDLLEGLASRFGGHALSVALPKSVTRFVLDSVRIVEGTRPRWDLMRADSLDEVHLRLSAVEWSGPSFDSVSAVVHDVRIDPVPSPELVTGSIDVVATASRESVASWIERTRPGWAVRPLSGRRIEVRPPRRRIGLVVVPSLDGLDVAVDVLAVALWAVEIPIPRRLGRRLSRRRRIALPALPRGAHLVGAEQDDSTVTFRLRHDGIREPILVEHVSSLIRGGASTLSLRPS